MIPSVLILLSTFEIIAPPRPGGNMKGCCAFGCLLSSERPAPPLCASPSSLACQGHFPGSWACALPSQGSRLLPGLSCAIQTPLGSSWLGSSWTSCRHIKFSCQNGHLTNLLQFILCTTSSDLLKI